MHDVHIVSELDVWLDGSVNWLALHLGLEHEFYWAELEPLGIPWEVWVDDIPIEVGKVGQDEFPFIDSQLKAIGNILEIECIFIPDPKLILVKLDVLFNVTLNSWPLCEFWTVHPVIILAAKHEVLSPKILCNMKRHLSVVLEAELEWWCRNLWLNRHLVASKHLELILDIGVQRKREAALQERLGQCTAESVEGWAFDVGLGSWSELSDRDVKTLDHVVATEGEQLGPAVTFLLRVGVDAAVMHEVGNPVSRGPIAFHALGTVSWLCDIDLDSRKVVVGLLVLIIVSIWSIDIRVQLSLTGKFDVCLRLDLVLGLCLGLHGSSCISFGRSLSFLSDTHFNMTAVLDKDFDVLGFDTLPFLGFFNFDGLRSAKECG